MLSLLVLLLSMVLLPLLREGPAAVGARRRGRRGRRRGSDGRRRGGRGGSGRSRSIIRRLLDVSFAPLFPASLLLLLRRRWQRGRRRRRGRSGSRRHRRVALPSFPFLCRRRRRRHRLLSSFILFPPPPLPPKVRRRQRGARDAPEAKKDKSPRREESGPGGLGPKLVARRPVGDEHGGEERDLAEAEEQERRAREEEGRGLILCG